MLQTIRDKAHGFFAWLILISIVVPFALWGIQNYTDGGKERPVVTVGGQEFFERDLARLREGELSGFTNLSEEQLHQAAMDRLVRDALIAREVERLKLAVGDDDLRALVQSLAPFQTNGRFDKERYRQVVTARGVTPQGFTSQMRSSVLMDQFQQAVAHTGFATTRQVDQYFRLKEQQRSFDYAVVPVAPDDAKVPEQAVQDYYNARATEFRTPEQVTVDVISLRLDDVARRIAVTDETLRAYYDEQKSSYITPEKRRVSHILVSVPPNADAAAYRAAQEKAEQIRVRLGKEEFAQVAREVSDDTDTNGRGGDLGPYVPGQMERNFEEAVMSLAKVGDTTPPVKTPFGYHIIRLTDLQPGQARPFEAVKPELTANYQRGQAEKEFYDLGQRMGQVSFENPDQLDPVAKSVGAEVERVGPFSRTHGEGLAAQAPFREAAFSADVLEGRNSEALEVASDHVVILRVREHTQAAQKPLGAVRETIAGNLRMESARAAARAATAAALAELRQGKPLAQLVKDKGWALRKAQGLKRDSKNAPRELLESVFRFPQPAAGQTYWGVVTLESQEQALVGLNAVVDGNPAAVSVADHDQVRDLLAQVQGQGQFTSLLEQVWKTSDVEIAERKNEH